MRVLVQSVFFQLIFSKRALFLRHLCPVLRIQKQLSTALLKTLVVIGGILPSASNATTDPYTDRFDTFQSGTWLNTANLLELIQSENIQSLPQLLESLKKNDPALMDQYLLSFRSRSLQESSPLAPRVIIVADHARFAMSFNGDKKHSGFESLEVMEFKEREKKFELREIKFIEDGLPHVSEANPSRCLKCHQSSQRPDVDPRPNWEPYSMWPGFYGAFTGELKSSPLLSDRRLREEDQILKQDALSELGNLKTFESEVKPTHSRYQHLGKFDPKNTVNYTEGLNTLNLQRVLRLIESSEDFSSYRWSLFSALKCSNFALPEEVADAHFQGATLLKLKRLKTFIHKINPDPEFAEFRLKYLKNFSHLSLDMILTFLFEPRGISTTDWGMDFRTERGRFAFAERFGSPTFPKASFIKLAGLKWPELNSMSCEDLEQKSLSANYDLSKFEKPLAPEAQLRKTVGKCLSCHGVMESTWTLAPALPFGSKLELLNTLSKEQISKMDFYNKVKWNTGAHATLKEQMPPGEGLTSQERTALLEYLEEMLEL